MSRLSLSTLRTHSSVGRVARASLLSSMTLVAFTIASSANAQTATCRKEPCQRQNTATLSPTYGSIQVDSAGRGLPVAQWGLSGGPADAPTDNNSACLGFTAESPDHVMTIAQTIPMLRVAVASEGDTTLLIHGPYGWTCNDDANGFNPALETEFPAGTYRIWVGSYIMGEYHDYTLSVDYAQAPMPTPTPTPPGPTMIDAGSFTSLGPRADAGPSELASGVVLVGRASGDIDTAYIGSTATGACSGITSQAPSHIVNLTTAPRTTISMALQNPSALGLVLHGPNGWVCAPPDLNTVLTATMDPGTYRIWVTAEGRTGQRADYTLNLFSGSAVAPAPTPTPAALLAVRGNFEGMDVAFTGTTIDELHNACTSFAASSDSLDWVDDIVLNGASYRNSARYWDASALCAIVALNARPEGSSSAVASVVGNLEGTPFEVHGTADQVRSVLTRYLPLAVDMAWADDLVVNGQTRRNSSSYWNAAEVIMVIMSLAR
jgi:hypothetical protein